MKMSRLPIYEIESEIVNASKSTNRIIIHAPTGSGKSTQVPQILLKNKLLGDTGEVVVLQPRRLPARMLAVRVANELKVTLGEEVGYQVRFENKISSKTRIRYVTEGVLLRQMLQNKKLPGVKALIFDEFHERHLYGDITLAQALEIQKKYTPELLIIVMSATLDSEMLSEYLSPCKLSPCKILASEGRTYPVQVRYQPSSMSPNIVSPIPIWDQAVKAFAKIRREQRNGDVLIFMPGSYEIYKTIDSLRHCPETVGHILLPLHGELSNQEQDAAISEYDNPKIVVTTNVAETSLTINGINVVIDSGLARIPRYDPSRGIDTLWIEKISQASADQRAGRAGRTAPGVCVRLWSESEHYLRPLHELPEIQRVDLAELVLMLKALGINDLNDFNWLEKPDAINLYRAVALLKNLGAFDKNEKISELGRQMLAFPIHPRYARMLMSAKKYGCQKQAALIAALTQSRDILVRKVDKFVVDFREQQFDNQRDSDFSLLICAWEYARKNNFRLDACKRAGVHAGAARQVQQLYLLFLRQIGVKNLEEKLENIQDFEVDDSVRKCILTGFSDRLAKRLDTGTLRCELPYGRIGELSRESIVDASLFVAAEINEIEFSEKKQMFGSSQAKQMNMLLSLATTISPKWIEELYPQEIEDKMEVHYDSLTKSVVAEKIISFRGISLFKKNLSKPPLADAAKLLAEEIMQGRLQLKYWDNSVEQWILRLNLLVKWCPELEFPEITEQSKREMLEDICMGSASYKEIKDKEIKNAVKSWLSFEQQRLLEKLVPERVDLPNGKHPKVTYLADGNPFISMRIQELYDIQNIPKIANKRITPTLHILAPNMRPVQITKDLQSFWNEYYPKVKSELQRKYPKHKWR